MRRWISNFMTFLKRLKNLHYAGFDIFYLMTGEYSGSEPALKIASFEYSIKDMSPEEKK